MTYAVVIREPRKGHRDYSHMTWCMGYRYDPNEKIVYLTNEDDEVRYTIDLTRVKRVDIFNASRPQDNDPVEIFIGRI